MIRPAVAGDIPAVLERGERFFESAGWPAVVEWDEPSVRRTLENLIASDDGILLVIDDGQVRGMAGALVYPFYFNAAHRTGQEMFWWVDPDARGGDALKLFAGLEQAAREAGAQSFAMLSVEGLRSPALARFYRRRGYRPAENTFIKRL